MCKNLREYEDEEVLFEDYYLLRLSFEPISDEVQEILDEYDFEFRDIDLHSQETKKEIVKRIEELNKKLGEEDEN